MSSEPPQQRGSGALILAVIACAILIGLLGWKMLQPKEEIQFDDGSAFNLDEVPQQDPSRSIEYESQFEREARRRREDVEGPGLAGFVPETGGQFAGTAGKRRTGPGSRKNRAPAINEGVSAAQRKREKRFWKKYAAAYYKFGAKMTRIGRKYRKKSKKLAEADRYFGGLPRFMALKNMHDAGKIDAYEFWRGATSLPEFRQGVRKYMGQKEILQIAVQVAAEGLAAKPSKALYREGFRVVTEDETISGFMSEEFWPKVAPGLPGALIDTEMPEGSAQAVQDVATDLTNAQTARARRLQEQAKREYKGR